MPSLWRQAPNQGCLLAIALLQLFLVVYLVHGPSSSLPIVTVTSNSPLIRGLYENQNTSTRQQQHGSDLLTNSRSASSLVGCLTDDCIRSLASQLAYAYDNRSDKSWCIRPQNSKDHVFRDSQGLYRGIVLIKVPKAASSTSAGVAIRIGRRLNCTAVQWMHKPASQYGVDGIHFQESFVFTTLRDPGARAVSSVFFHFISRSAKEDEGDAFILRQLKENCREHYGTRSEGKGGFQLSYTSLEAIPIFKLWSPEHPTVVQNPDILVDIVQKTLARYDFIILTERMDESLVAMSLLMGLDVGEVLVTASKVAGSRYHLVKPAGKDMECLPTVKSPANLSRPVVSYLESDEWRAANYGDYLLYQAANQSLDKTIAALGHERFQTAMTRYQRLRAIEQERCAPFVQFPCSNQGKPQPRVAKDHCYMRNYDFGCGYKCIDKILKAEPALQR